MLTRRLRILAIIGKLARITCILPIYYWFSDRILYLAGDRWKRPELTEYSQQSAARIALCSIYQPMGISRFVRRQLEYIRELGYDIAVIAPHPLKDDDLNYVSSLCRYLVTRQHFGVDFASFKDAILSIGFERLAQYERVLLVNDSLLFPLGETARFEQQFRSANADVVGLFENASVARHIQSFFIDLSSRVMCSPQSQAFWNSYRPYRSRYHAIGCGEIQFSQAVLYKVADTIQLLYSQENIYEAVAAQVQSEDDAAAMYALLSDVFLPKHSPAIVPDIGPRERLLRHVRYLLEATNISHSCALLVVTFMSAPFLKRDLYFRLSYDLAQLKAVLSGQFEKELLERILLEFRKRGSIRNLGTWSSILHFAGAK